MFIYIIGHNVPIPSLCKIHKNTSIWRLQMRRTTWKNKRSGEKSMVETYWLMIGWGRSGWASSTWFIALVWRCSWGPLMHPRRWRHGDWIYKILKDVVKEVVKHNVVKVVIDNGSNYTSAGLKLSRLSCVLDTLRLTLYRFDVWRYIMKIDTVKGTIRAAGDVTKFIYNRSNVLSSYRTRPQVK